MNDQSLDARDEPRHDGTRRWLLGAAAIVLLTLIVYAPATTGEFLWDDDYHLSRNPLIPAPDGLWRIWTTTESPQYYPLVFTSFWLEYRLWGDRTPGYHVTNILLHAVNAILLWAAMRRLRIPGGWLAGALFALHPVNVESVAWITERKNVLSGLFYLLSLLTFLRFDRGGRRRWLLLSALLFLAALFSKTSTVMLPVVLGLLLWWRGGLRRKLPALVPYFVLAAVMAAVTIWYERHAVGALGEDWSATPLQRLCLASRVLWLYLARFLVPLKLTFVYPRWEPDTAGLTAYLPTACVIIVALGLIFGRPPGRRALPCGLGAFAAALFPVLGFFNVYYMRFASTADHFAYLAGMCLMPLLIGGAAGLAAHMQRSRSDRARARKQHLLRGAAVLLLVVAGALTFQRCRIFRSNEALWTDTLAKNPNAWLAHHGLANILARRGEYERAIAHYQRTLRLKPTLTPAYHNQRIALMALDRHQEAIDLLRVGVRQAADRNKVSVELATLLAACPQTELRDCAEAAAIASEICKTSVAENEPYAPAFDALAAAHACRGDFDQAAGTMQEALSIAEQEGDTAQVAEYALRLWQYREGQPYEYAQPIVEER